MFSEVVEGVLGARGKGGGNSVLGETKEAVIGGCWGLLMSGAFFFSFFTAVMVWLFGINEYNGFKLSGASVPFILALCASGFLSPFIGVMFGLQGGQYSATRHVGCFILYIGVLIAAIIGITLAL